jgi:hypothetical protein
MQGEQGRVENSSCKPQKAKWTKTMRMQFFLIKTTTIFIMTILRLIRKKHRGFPTEVSDRARNMKMELLTFYLILYQSKNCGHRTHELFMMYDVY